MPYETRDVFSLMNRGVSALYPPGEECGKAMRTLDKEFKSRPSPTNTVAMVMRDKEVRVLFRVRCGLCRKQCKKPLT